MSITRTPPGRKALQSASSTRWWCSSLPNPSVLNQQNTASKVPFSTNSAASPKRHSTDDPGGSRRARAATHIQDPRPRGKIKKSEELSSIIIGLLLGQIVLMKIMIILAEATLESLGLHGVQHASERHRKRDTTLLGLDGVSIESERWRPFWHDEIVEGRWTSAGGGVTFWASSSQGDRSMRFPDRPRRCWPS